MRTTRNLALLLSVSVAWSVAHAGPAHDDVWLRLGAFAQHADIREYADTGTRLVRERHVLPGWAVAADQMIGPWRWSAELSYANGALRYDGQTQAGSAFTSKTDTTLLKARARLLHQLDEDGRLAAGLGIGYRHWKRLIRGHGNVRGLNERFTTWELSAQAQASVVRGNTAAVDINLQLAWPIAPHVKTDFGGLYDTQTMLLGQRLATRLSIPVSWTVGPRSRMVVEPSVEAWGLGRSRTDSLMRHGEPVGVAHQPRVRGHDIELSVSWMQSF